MSFAVFTEDYCVNPSESFGNATENFAAYFAIYVIPEYDFPLKEVIWNFRKR